MKDPSSTINNTNVNNKRRRKDESNRGGGEEEEEPKADFENKKKKMKKTEVLKELLTSFILLDEQEKSDQQEWDKISQHESSLLDSNHKKKTQTMLDYYSDFQDYYSDLEESDRFLIQQSRLSVNKIATQIAANPKSKDSKSIQGHQRRLWVKDRSKAWWDQCNHPDFPESDFRKAFRMSRATFDMICEELNLAVTKQNTMLRDAIPTRQRVAVCIWRLATGEPLRLVSKRFGLGISTCHKLVLEVCSAIKTVLMPKFLQWPDEERLRKIEKEFESVSRIPNVVGSMYTTHIPIIAPKISVAAYFNKRHTERNQKTSYSITVQGVVDPKGVFTDVCIGWPGSMPDDQVLEKSALYQRANGGQLQGSWVVGSCGFPLMDWVLVPYTQQNLTWTQHAFNEKIGEIQFVAKSAFARLKGRWGCLQKRTEMKLQDLPVVLGACCVLHNICEMMNEEMDPDVQFELNDDEMVPENSLRSMSSKNARDNIAHNLLHHGLAGTSFL
ncbi:Harbinger transposase-derived nuclease [Macleaya cordata]|uniref:Harbinger transposase-derived nuclease n=1 Tax=Macleaya cordata TaxID=56857 RepID=A0A200Q1X0_MACCD|nr:Harbinger transposase-derived nuclease [Macleaya cordata]